VAMHLAAADAALRLLVSAGASGEGTPQSAPPSRTQGS
jgi:hypothetical protein